MHHDAAAAVAGVPLGEQVLVPGPEVSGVRCHRRRSGAPQPAVAGGEGGVGDLDGDLPRGLGGEVAAPDVPDPFFAVAVPALGRAAGDRADAGVGAVGVDRQHQPFARHLGMELTGAGDRGDALQAAGTQHGFLEHVDQRPHLKAAADLAFDTAQVARLGRGLGRGELDRPGLAFGDLDPLQIAGCLIQRRQLAVVLGAAGLEIDRQVLIGLRQRSAPTVQSYNPSSTAGTFTCRAT